MILNSNDTISGSINYGGKKENSLKCVFKKEGESESVVYYPEDIKAYRYTESKYYVSGFVKAGDSVKIFMEFLFDGIVDLYYYYDNQTDHYLIGKKGTDLKELKNDIIKKTIDNVVYTRETKEYIGVLKTYFTDSPNALKEAENMSLTANSLITISEDYHNEVCTTEKCIVYEKKMTSIKLTVGPVLGYAFSNFNITGGPFFNSFEFATKGSGTMIGASFNLKDPSLSEKFSIQFELTLRNYNYLTTNATLKSSAINFPLLIKYTPAFKKIKPSVLAGFELSETLSLKNTVANSGYFVQTEGKEQLGFITGLELEFPFNKSQGMFFQLRYEYLKGQHISGVRYFGTFISEHPIPNSDLKNISFIIGMNF